MHVKFLGCNVRVSPFADGFWLVSEDVEVERLDLGRQIDSITLPSAWEVLCPGMENYSQITALKL